MLSTQSVDCCVRAILHILNPDWIEIKRRTKKNSRIEMKIISFRSNVMLDTKYSYHETDKYLDSICLGVMQCALRKRATARIPSSQQKERFVSEWMSRDLLEHMSSFFTIEMIKSINCSPPQWFYVHTSICVVLSSVQTTFRNQVAFMTNKTVCVYTFWTMMSNDNISTTLEQKESQTTFVDK